MEALYTKQKYEVIEIVVPKEVGEYEAEWRTPPHAIIHGMTVMVRQNESPIEHMIVMFGERIHDYKDPTTGVVSEVKMDTTLYGTLSIFGDVEPLFACYPQCLGGVSSPADVLENKLINSSTPSYDGFQSLEIDIGDDKCEYPMRIDTDEVEIIKVCYTDQVNKVKESPDDPLR